MPTAILEIYNHVLSTLSLTKRLRLATLILNSLIQESIFTVEDRDTWTEQDQLDPTTFSSQHAVAAFPENKDIAE